MALTILALITAEEGQEDKVHNALEKLIAPTRAERGCLLYDLHVDNDDPRHFVFYEIWENRELWQDHLKSPHIVANNAATEGAVASVVIHELTKTD